VQAARTRRPVLETSGSLASHRSAIGAVPNHDLAALAIFGDQRLLLELIEALKRDHCCGWARTACVSDDLGGRARLDRRQ
jgi:hypothetical protein